MKGFPPEYVRGNRPTVLPGATRRRGPRRRRTSSAEDVLGERYDRGEITAEEYRQRLRVLQRKSD